MKWAIVLLFLVGAVGLGAGCSGVQSPRGSIAYVSKSGLRFVKLDGSDDHAVTTGHDDSPVWSPDGGRLAFNRSGALYVVQQDGRLRQVPGSRRGDRFYGWSPDGTSVAFGHTECSSKPFNLHFMVVSLRTGKSVRVAALANPEKSIWLDGVSWSPDGKRILYVVSTDPKVTCHGITGLPTPTSRVYTIGADGRGRRVVRSIDYEAVAPEWSRDGKRIALISMAGSGVTVGNADGSGFTEVADEIAHAAFPADGFLANVAFADGGGNVVVYVSNYGQPGPGPEGLYKVELLTRRVRALVHWKTTADSRGRILAVSKDGRRIGIARSDGTVFVLAGNRILYRSQKKFSDEFGISLHLQ